MTAAADGWCGYCDSQGRIAFVNDGLPGFKCPRCGGTQFCTCNACREHFRRVFAEDAAPPPRTTPVSKEINEPTICPHCEKPLQRIDMTRDDSGAEPMWLVRIAGRMNATALKNIAKLIRGWAS